MKVFSEVSADKLLFFVNSENGLCIYFNGFILK